MAFYSRRGNWGYNPYKKYKSGSGARRSKGNFKASRQTKDAMNLVVKCNTCLSSAYDATHDGGVAVINVYEVLRTNPQFASFVKLYDQVKVGGIKVKLNVVDAQTTVSQINQIKNINVVTAWDRTGLSKDQVKFYDSNNEEIIRNEWDTSGVHHFAPWIGKGIVNATGVDKSILNSFQRWNRSPFLYPSTMEEKSQYLSTSNFEETVASYDYSTGNYFINDSNDATPITELFNSANPCLPFESPSCKWKPTLMIGVFTSSYDSTNKAIKQYDSCEPVLFNAEFSIDVTFRNMKASTKEIGIEPQP
jgi:hypothetical protein